jgi:hypothetical protein
MKILCGFFLLILSAISCKKNNQSAVIVPGDYEGTFTRTIGSTDSIATIQMNFSGSRFSGESDNPRFPGICEGGYGMIGDSISFGNDCLVPWDYKNSTRLFGNYILFIRGDSVIFSRTIGDFVYEADFYRLKKQ